MTLSRSKIAEMQVAIYRTEHNGAPAKVFGQIRDDGQWFEVTEIKVVRKLLWIKLRGRAGTSFMAHNVKLVEDLPAIGA